MPGGAIVPRTHGHGIVRLGQRVTDQVRRVASGFRIQQADDVDSTVQRVDGSVLVYKTATGLWTPQACPIFRAHQTISQSLSGANIVTGLPVVLNFNSTVDEDTASAWDSTNHRYNVTQAGLYAVACQAEVTMSWWDGSSSIDITAEAYIRWYWGAPGSPKTRAWMRQGPITLASQISLMSSDLVRCGVGDIIQAGVVHDFPSDLVTSYKVGNASIGLEETFLTIARVGN